MAILDLQGLDTPEALSPDAISTLSLGGCHNVSTLSFVNCG
jgi:hypothetical protein